MQDVDGNDDASGILLSPQKENIPGLQIKKTIKESNAGFSSELPPIPQQTTDFISMGESKVHQETFELKSQRLIEDPASSRHTFRSLNHKQLGVRQPLRDLSNAKTSSSEASTDILKPRYVTVGTSKKKVFEKNYADFDDLSTISSLSFANTLSGGTKGTS